MLCWHEVTPLFVAILVVLRKMAAQDTALLTSSII